MLRDFAKLIGCAFYFTDKRCRSGNLALRRTSSGSCECPECRAKSKAASDSWRKTNPLYYQQWYARNRDSVIDRVRSHQSSSDEEYKSYQAEYRAKNRGSLARLNKDYRERNRNTLSEKSRQRYVKNRESILSSKRENRAVHNAVNAKRRSAKARAVPPWYGEFDDFAIREAYQLAKSRTQETGIPWQVDHMVPLQAVKCSGLHCADNVQVIPAVMNNQKHNRMVLTKRLEWLER